MDGDIEENEGAIHKKTGITQQENGVRGPQSDRGSQASKGSKKQFVV